MREREAAAIDVVDNPVKGQFEARVNGQLAIAAYVLRRNTLILTHTEVPEALRHQGIGTALAKGALEKARAEGWTVVPRCPFIAAYIAQHTEYQALL